nr:uncharacterized protein K02A2.6-like [Rhipicephalus microplus]
MDNLFRGMRHVAVYLDDILDAGLKLKVEKCIFLAPSVEYLGHVISLAGLAPAPHKVEAVLKAPKPQNKKELQSYLGLINFYRTFLPNLSSHLQPLHLLLRDGQQWAWRKEQDLAFQRSKELITKAPVLVHVNPAKPVILTVDASPYGVGAALAHREKNDQERPISFVSQRFHQYLWGRRFEAVMDHKPLLGTAGARQGSSSAGVAWSVPEPAEVFMLEHAYPEVLSRSAVSQATSRDLVLSQVVKAVSRGEELAERTYSHKPAELSLQQGCLLWGSRVVIPQSLRSRILQLLHAGHPGVEKTKIVARSHVWWPGLNQDIARMVQSCQACQENQRASRHVKITPWPFPEKPWSRLPVDFGGPFKGHYFLVVVDTFSKWVEVLPVTTPSAGATIAALRQVFAAQGLPDLIVSDNGPAFVSKKYLAWLTKNGICRMMVPLYHPTSNGAAERVVQTVKDKLKKSKGGDVRTQVARALFQYWTTLHDVTGRAPCELLMSRMVKTPLDVSHPDLRSTALLKQLKQKLVADRGCRPGPLSESGAPVFARNFRPGPPWSAGGHVVSPASASSLLVRMSDGTTWHRHADHVRPRLATSAAAPSGSQQAREPSAVTDASTAPGAGATRTTVTPPASPRTPARRADSATATQAAPDVATPATPVLRRSARHRRPPDRYLPG